MYTLEQFISRYGELFEMYFEHLVGCRVEYVSGPYVEWGFITGDVELDDGTILPTHFRAATESEEAMNQEIPPDDDLTFDELYFGNIIEQTVQKIEVKADQLRNEVYLYFYISNHMYFEVPIGFNSTLGELYGFASELISQDEWEAYNIQ